MARQLFSSKKPKSARVFCLAPPNKQGREIKPVGLMRERFHRPEFHYQGRGACSDRYAYIKGYN